MEPDGVSEEFTSEWVAETYRQQLIEKVQEREAKDWLYVEHDIEAVLIVVLVIQAVFAF